MKRIRFTAKKELASNQVMDIWYESYQRYFAETFVTQISFKDVSCE